MGGSSPLGGLFSDRQHRTVPKRVAPDLPIIGRIDIKILFMSLNCLGVLAISKADSQMDPTAAPFSLATHVVPEVGREVTAQRLLGYARRVPPAFWRRKSNINWMLWGRGECENPATWIETCQARGHVRADVEERRSSVRLAMGASGSDRATFALLDGAMDRKVRVAQTVPQRLAARCPGSRPPASDCLPCARAPC